jgi:signal transduction histidine kinase
MLSPDDSPVHGRVDAEGRLVMADPALADLHARAGGERGGPLAVPQLATLARLARRLAIPVSRAVIAADGEEDLDLWVRARPDGSEVALAIAGWKHRLAAPPIEAAGTARDYDFIRADADWTWEADATLRLVALSAEGMGAFVAVPALGEALTRLFVLEEGETGGPPLLEALARHEGFDEQIVTLRGTALRFRLAGVPLIDPLGRMMGFRGGGFALDPPVAPVVVPSAQNDDVVEAKGAFARRLDSALRTPLNRIVATAEQIRERDEGPLRTDYSGYAGDIANAGRHLLGLIDDLVDLEAVERDAIRVEPEPLDLADLARRASGLLSVRAHDKDIRIEQPDLAETMPAVGDFRRALQVLVNLIGNAVHYGPEGSTVRVSVERRGGGVAAAIVADQGRGIAPADAERVFEKFERLGAHESGTGLGLYISRRLARAMRGEIKIESGAGESARFVFTLPAE